MSVQLLGKKQARLPLLKERLADGSLSEERVGADNPFHRIVLNTASPGTAQANRRPGSVEFVAPHAVDWDNDGNVWDVRGACNKSCNSHLTVVCGCSIYYIY